MDGLAWPVDGLDGPVHGFSFFLFVFLLTEAGMETTSVNAWFYCDLSLEAFFCPPSQIQNGRLC